MKDKIFHFLVCLVASLGVGMINPFAGAMFAAGLGIGKEYGDSKATGNHWCWWDLLADALGLAIGTAAAVLLRKLIGL